MQAGSTNVQSAARMAEAVRSGEISPLRTVGDALACIRERDDDLGAFVHVCSERALSEAEAMQTRIARGEDPGPLAGVPLGVKDLEDVAGLPTQFGSTAFRGNMATTDSAQVARLRAAGAIVVGKTATPEFGYTAFTKSRVSGVTRNPWNLDRTPGGSSGGSAAAIAARMVPLATASDGGGSIRIPACFVGAFGFKPSFGRIPQGPEPFGMLRWADTVHYGPITRTVEDAALFLDVASGYHPCDPFSLPAPGLSYRDAIARGPGKLRIVFARTLGYGRTARDVMREVEASVDVLARLGHEIEERDLSLADMAHDWGLLSGAEIYSDIARLVEGREHELGRTFWRGTLAAGRIDAARIGEAQRRRNELNVALGELFEGCDVLVTPMMPTEAFPAAGPMPAEIDGVALESPMHATAFTYAFNFSGHPAATMRAGFGDTGLPVGLQIVAERHRDEVLLQLAAQYERERPMLDWP